jgi:hypothetical protein
LTEFGVEDTEEMSREVIEEDISGCGRVKKLFEKGCPDPKRRDTDCMDIGYDGTKNLAAGRLFFSEGGKTARDNRV